jgi:serine/threonine-protein kinase RsbW
MSHISTPEPKPAIPKGLDRCEHETVRTELEIGPLCDRLSASMTAAGFSNRDIFAVRLAVEEAVMNAIKHGHQGDTCKTVRVGYHLESDRVVIEVEDEGPGFDPGKVADPLSPENFDRSTGRGLRLMRHYMTWIKHNPRGNRVSMCKCRSS